ncbi:ribosome small subunit-dependent GTPase A [Secundilactobacillus kimchicus JCM 15530]|uniref:Small ribosomal subunit biogenesis GTPase RsgA n=1 Tax=Secundilactobacillus kimchicus JCM 15530 TaxID=1302272 RepID=A0A0R1HYY8_9LACO|nr:ribosome small subunit-dependent GTPase A [Secundilactobacillus kimchicus]KRK48849.1 ribosome small subunit-dependent GTPase A [Secundilactobacillus kimchicus JCM 15530]
MNLNDYGATHEQPLANGLMLARIIATSHQQYTIVTDAGRYRAQIAGRLANQTVEAVDFPTVGDWVQVRLPENADDTATIERLNPRQTVFLRKTAGRRSDAQLVAANVDWLLLCMALDANFNLRRLERYLAVAAASGARAAIVLTKADKAADLAAQLAAVAEITSDQPVLVCDATTAAGLTELTAFMQPRVTYAFLGSSGVGKTTLINPLLGHGALLTAAVREHDAHGRHTTTSRQLLVLANGSVVIDTPGMRELGLLDANVDAAFDDVKALAARCRFSDCTHQQEPGCAVRAAVSAGELDKDRLESYLQLQTEQAQNSHLRGKARENAKIERMFGGKKQMKAMMKEARKKRR